MQCQYINLWLSTLLSALDSKQRILNERDTVKEGRVCAKLASSLKRRAFRWFCGTRFRYSLHRRYSKLTRESYVPFSQ